MVNVKSHILIKKSIKILADYGKNLDAFLISWHRKLDYIGNLDDKISYLDLMKLVLV